MTRREPGRPEQVFRARLAEAGSRMEEPVWLGVMTRHRVVCAAGHHATARPNDVNRGTGVCRTCGPTSPERAEQKFRTAVTGAGGRVIEPAWLGVKVRHRVVCAAGHEATPVPVETQRTGSICRTCAGHDSTAAEREFRRRVAEVGGQVTEPVWLGNKANHSVTCAAGHKVTTRPNNVQQGFGFCRFCAYKVWDVFYVVTNDLAYRVKFGITSNDARDRLRRHRANGYRTVVLVRPGLPDAPNLERAVLSTLALAGVSAAQGREYFDVSALPIVLDVAGNWP